MSSIPLKLRGVALSSPAVAWTQSAGAASAPSPFRAGRQEEVEALRRIVSALQDRVRALEEKTQPQTVILRQVSREQAKQELTDYFRARPDSYPSDAALELGLDATEARQLCAELLREGVLEG